MNTLTPKQQFKQACHLFRLHRVLENGRIELFDAAYTYDQHGPSHLNNTYVGKAAKWVRQQEDIASRKFHSMPKQVIKEVELSHYWPDDPYQNGNWLRKRNSAIWNKWLDAHFLSHYGDIPF